MLTIEHEYRVLKYGVLSDGCSLVLFDVPPVHGYRPGMVLDTPWLMPGTLITTRVKGDGGEFDGESTTEVRIGDGEWLPAEWPKQHDHDFGECNALVYELTRASDAGGER